MTADLSPILRSIDCIERRLRAPFRVADAAAAAGYSLFHFSRVFSQAVRQSPYEYLMRRRLSQAALNLLESRRRVLDVALDFQFDTPEGFSRAFKRMFGQQPQQFRKQNRLDPRLLMPRLTEEYLHCLPQVPPTPLRECREALELAGLMALCPPDEACPPPTLLEQVAAELRAHLPRREPLPVYALTLYLRGWERRGRACFAGVPAAALARTPPAFAAKTLPAGEYAAFPCAGAQSALAAEAYLFHTWLPHAGISPLLPLTARRFHWDSAAAVFTVSGLLVPAPQP